MHDNSRPTFVVALLLLAVPVLALPASAAMAADDSGLWTDFNESGFSAAGERWIVPDTYRAVRLDRAALEALLERTPLERVNDPRPKTVLELPMPDGSRGRFEIVESPIMEKELAAKFREIRTYRGQGVDDLHATLRFDLTPKGFHAAVLSPAGNVYIDPYSDGDTEHYVSYFTRDYTSAAAGQFRCGVHSTSAPVATRAEPLVPSGTELRTYRLAVAATGEYTSFHGGTVPDGMAAIVTAMNRVNGVYEREVAINMTLVASNSLVVYTNGATDPYTNNNGVAMLGQNQTNLDAVIGDANYDVGHVFSTGGGGVASLRVPCITGAKARGVTGLPSPTGDVFYIDFVAHELGHQWGGNHSFNGNAGNCSGGNRNPSTAYEPGSGSTIMAYAGICGSNNIQQTSDDYFHGISFDEIVAYSTTGNGNNCPVVTATGNNPPTVDPGSSETIPISTPFELCGSGSDPDTDPLTYSWEQFDLGPAGHPNSPSGNAAIFRSFPSVPSGCRTFPQLSDLLGNTQTIGEILPSYTRTLHFRLTARDNRSGGGGVNFDQTTVVDVTDTSGPFLVTDPNTSIMWNYGENETVTWDVAGTDSAPVSCANVDILVSDDGGSSYLHTLATSTPNDGSHAIVVPNTIPETTQGRLKVLCSSSIFFDISDANFAIGPSTEIFDDGFESGDTSMWSVTVP